MARNTLLVTARRCAPLLVTARRCAPLLVSASSEDRLGARRIETVHAGNLGSERARNHGIGAFKSRQHLRGHLGRPALATTQQRVERAIVQ